ncbi:ATPase [Enterocloster clostridioformis]|uniref:cation-translocating P-type ATPase n=1 Tax=Enterocloster clostridioformis TaxID=1531 RepID=UPI00080C6DDB|nr:cation-translocating P-type ATPase [Enterocloster clostridioformis]ANU47595.1 ATPase [Lachnoclostridium sp. YL32]NDO30770.1 cation-translocating P-type ATPase [Enterocloster clostridioformis]OXE66215.1 ATPase [Enterocloster clostridioformis]QQR03505.1 cation-translocating P-type ATPase [Enterocloster clostridioformis]
MADWFEQPEAEVLAGLDSGRQGIDSGEAQQRLKEYGENVLEEAGRLQWWQVFLAQFKDLLVIILIGAAAVSMLTGDPESAMVIFAVLLLNAVLGTVQHQKAEKSLDSLKRLSSPEARVLRDGRSMTIPSALVVPGDILLLETGDMVAADGRLLEVYGLTVNESSLTGESLGVEKHTGAVKAREGTVALADRTNMVFSGSLVTSGRAVAVVTATGMNTEIGKIAVLMNGTKEQKTPLQVSLDRFSGHLAIAIIAICGLVFLLSLYRREPVLDALMFAVALAVAAIPEALSSIVTIVQAMGTQKMAREQAIIKDLKAVESLGCVSVICSDKTGTLTQNRMDVEQVYINHTQQQPSWLENETRRNDVRLLLMAAVLNNNASGQDGDPMETALFNMAREAGLIPEQVRLQSPRKGEIPFDSRRKLMTTINEIEGSDIVFVKGAVDVLLKKCTRLANPAAGQKAGTAGPGAGAAIPSRTLSSSDRQRILDQNSQWSARGLRVLAFACRPLNEAGKENGNSGYAEAKAGNSREQSSLSGRLEDDLVFLGLTAMMDPPRPESRQAVASARQAGIRPVMITGDHKVTAMSIAERIGIFAPGNMAVTGAELDRMEEEDLNRNLEHISVYARVSPEHKIRIVRAWQNRGHIVAMTGDGVNDAPALKKADIGVAMGITGTEVSKDAASMILADDNFATIIKAVSNGRNVYRNIKNSIQFLLSGNMAGIFCVLYTSLLSLPLPFKPVHLLFINLITDSLPAIAIGMEPPEEGLLKEPPRNPKEGILTASFIRDILVQGALIAAATMWAYTTGLHEGGAGRACTMAFSTLTLARLFHGFNCRSSHSIIRLGLGSNLYSVMAFQLGVVLLAAVLFVPGLQIMFAAADLSLSQLTTLAAAAFLPALVIQIHKILRESIY